MRALVGLGLLLGGPALAGNAAIYGAPSTLAVEDVPTRGDEDTNDAVFRVSSRCVVAPDGTLLAMRVHLAGQAKGAAYTNEIRWQLPWTPTSVTASFGAGSAQALTVLPGDEVTVFSDASAAFADAPAGFVNTEVGHPIADGVPVVLEAAFQPGYSVLGPGASCPRADLVVVRPDDAVRIGPDATFTNTNQPMWARFGGTFGVPVERTRIGDAYLDYLPFVQELIDGCTPGVDCLYDAWYADPQAGLVIDRPALAIEAPLAVQPTCSDNVQNADEQGVDCGGLACGLCYVDCAGAPVDVTGLVVWQITGTTVAGAQNAHLGRITTGGTVSGWVAYNPSVAASNTTAVSKKYTFTPSAAGQFEARLVNTTTTGVQTCMEPRPGGVSSIQMTQDPASYHQVALFMAIAPPPGSGIVDSFPYSNLQMYLTDSTRTASPGLSLPTAAPILAKYAARELSLSYNGGSGFDGASGTVTALTGP